MNLVKFLRTPFLQNTSGGLLLIKVTTQVTTDVTWRFWLEQRKLWIKRGTRVFDRTVQSTIHRTLGYVPLKFSGIPSKLTIKSRLRSLVLKISFVREIF